jgi:hypothetical protein
LSLKIDNDNDNWVNLLYNTSEKSSDEFSVLSAVDYIFGYNNHVTV